tara:strand:- start:464 stop:1213 length:750 start_codon:yes stop_codon:yes gene_type:complete
MVVDEKMKNDAPTENAIEETPSESTGSEDVAEDTKTEEVPESSNEDETEEEMIEDVVEQKPAGSSRDKDNLYEEIEIPEGIVANIDDDVLTMKKDDKEIKRKLVSLIDVEIKGNKIVVSATRNRKIERKLFGTFKAHVNNMIKGLTEGFEYKLRVSNVHFPMNVSYDANKNLFTIKNFLGEKKDRIINGIPGVDVSVKGEDVIVTGFDIEKTGQVATNIEKGARIRNKDRRIFQDGIHMIAKPGRVYLE